ncbi:alpha/beta hydrolase [Goodfellowiella coeruleoviolacea]|uniref:Carboxylesterase n=1 Tax=Goodfellowiella coeruleoviolacea TaxID=334858 RepID=A0AAE3GBZ3_9PSEU|nr:alpha/beta fold hydrolase [Goodfellowiella coeruleoviolacea]MCP2165325.1 carboxylesterase [Goodfellowiella coeruleoviolacea]
MPVLAGAEPFAHQGSDEVGVLLCHGFTGSPQSMRPWGEHLAAEGFTVSCPRLPGHGTTWQEMNRTRWPEWYGRVEEEFLGLTRRCASVFVFGLSMGGTLTLRLAQRHGAAVAGIALVNPSVTSLRREMVVLPVLSRLVPSVAPIGGAIAKPGVRELAYPRTPLRALASLRELWGLVRADLDRVTQPLALFHSVVDSVVEPVNSRIVLDGVRSTDVTEVVLPNSDHVATLDHDAPTIFAGSVEFVRRVHRERLGEPA